MKKSGAFIASMAAASATAISSSSSSSDLSHGSKMQPSPKETAASREDRSASSTEKFAPKFDGLRFIETLVTAHR
ncbi:hypothetical protein ACLOJK_009829 [Asimina triloba]